MHEVLVFGPSLISRFSKRFAFFWYFSLFEDLLDDFFVVRASFDVLSPSRGTFHAFDVVETGQPQDAWNKTFSDVFCCRSPVAFAVDAQSLY